LALEGPALQLPVVCVRVALLQLHLGPKTALKCSLCMRKMLFHVGSLASNLFCIICDGGGGSSRPADDYSLHHARYNIDFGRAHYYFEILSHAPLTSSAGGLCRRAAAESVTRRTINHSQSGREWKKGQQEVPPRGEKMPTFSVRGV
jgi:hypothetical protein